MELKLKFENKSNDCFLSAYYVVHMYRDHHWKDHNEHTDMFPSLKELIFYQRSQSLNKETTT